MKAEITLKFFICIFYFLEIKLNQKIKREINLILAHFLLISIHFGNKSAGTNCNKSSLKV